MYKRQAYEDAAQVLSNCKYSLNSTDAADDTYGYVYYAQLTEQAQSTADSLEQQKEEDRKSTRLNSSHIQKSRMPSSA